MCVMHCVVIKASQVTRQTYRVVAECLENDIFDLQSLKLVLKMYETCMLHLCDFKKCKMTTL